MATAKCPDGYFCGYGTTPETQFFNKCPAGYYCPEGTSASGRRQFACTKCFYCPEGTGLILPHCPQGTKTQPGAVSLDNCTADGITFWRIQPLKRSLILEILLAEQHALAPKNQSSPPPLPPPNPPPGPPPSPPPNPPGVSAPPMNMTPPFSANWNETIYDSYALCEPANFGLLTPFLVRDENLNVAYDADPAAIYPLVNYNLPRNYIAKMRFDWRGINPELIYGAHYELAIFVGKAAGQVN